MDYSSPLLIETLQNIFFRKKKVFVFLFALDCRLLPSWLTLVNDAAAVILFNVRSRKAHTQSLEKTTQTLKCVLALNYFCNV